MVARGKRGLPWVGRTTRPPTLKGLSSGECGHEEGFRRGNLFEIGRHANPKQWRFFRTRKKRHCLGRMFCFACDEADGVRLCYRLASQPGSTCKTCEAVVRLVFKPGRRWAGTRMYFHNADITWMLAGYAAGLSFPSRTTPANLEAGLALRLMCFGVSPVLVVIAGFQDGAVRALLGTMVVFFPSLALGRLITFGVRRLAARRARSED